MIFLEARSGRKSEQPILWPEISDDVRKQLEKANPHLYGGKDSTQRFLTEQVAPHTPMEPGRKYNLTPILPTQLA